MLFSDHGQMVIDNLASLKIFVVEMHNGVSGLSHCWQEFFLDNFGVMSVTFCHVLHLQGLLGFHLLNSLISQTHEDLIISIGIEIIITIFTDSDHTHNKITQQSITDLIDFFGRTPVFYFAKRQGAIKMLTYGAEFSAMKTGVEETIAT